MSMKGMSLKCKLLITVLVCLFLAEERVSTAGSGGHGHSAHWGYEGEGGPEHWGDLKPEFALCKEGVNQSPVDIRGAVKGELPPITVSYGATPLKVTNNGHAVQVNYEKGSFAVIGGKRYELLQFHFHSPSENRVDGRAYPLEAHLVHKGDDGGLAVIGVFLVEGERNGFIEAIWGNIPAEAGKTQIVDGVSVNVEAMLPAVRTYYRFPGSLTTPPCSEGVDWNVMATPIELSKEQISRFRSFYEMNARPVQPLNGRTIQAGGI